MTKRVLISNVIFLFLFAMNLFGQKIKEKDRIIGKWSECQDTLFDTNYKCNDNYRFEFFIDGSYKQSGYVIINNKQEPNVPGKWTLKGKKLFMTEVHIWTGAFKNHKDPTNKYAINWLNDNLFYTKGYDGNRLIYTYYQRMK